MGGKGKVFCGVIRFFNCSKNHIVRCVTGNTHNLASMSLSLELVREKGVNPLSRSIVDARPFHSHMLDF